jgi:hypothetical protein
LFYNAYYVALVTCIDVGLEIAKCFDLELKAGALAQHFNRNIKPNVKLIQEARARGKALDLFPLVHSARFPSVHVVFTLSLLEQLLIFFTCRDRSLLWQISHNQVYPECVRPTSEA